VALADEIAQQTHDLEDGLMAESVSLEEIERLGAAVAVMEHAGDVYQKERRRWRRAALLQRGLIQLFVTDAIQNTARAVNRVAARLKARDHARWREVADEIPAAVVAMSPRVAKLFADLKSFVYRFIINHQEVNRQDNRAHLVMTALFRVYHDNPLTLPTYALLRYRELSGRPYLRDVPIPQGPREVATYYHSDARFVRLVVDHLAGMSDRYALEEYESLYDPSAALRGATRS
jgi:dGTPase